MNVGIMYLLPQKETPNSELLSQYTQNRYVRYVIGNLVAISSLVVILLSLDPRFVGSNPDEDDGFLRQ
jgi:hypothetical protein